MNYTPRTLAELWQCSERHVRNLIKDGKLPAFRVGGKLLRISGDAVTEFESANTLQATADHSFRETP